MSDYPNYPTGRESEPSGVVHETLADTVEVDAAAGSSWIQRVGPRRLGVIGVLIALVAVGSAFALTRDRGASQDVYSSSPLLQSSEDGPGSADSRQSVSTKSSSSTSTTLNSSSPAVPSDPPVVPSPPAEKPAMPPAPRDDEASPPAVPDQPGSLLLSMRSDFGEKHYEGAVSYLSIWYGDPDAHAVPGCVAGDWGDGEALGVACVAMCATSDGHKGPGHDASVPELEHVYRAPGTYTVTVTYSPLYCGEAPYDAPVSAKQTITVHPYNPRPATDDEVSLMTVALRQLLLTDNTFGGGKVFGEVAVGVQVVDPTPISLSATQKNSVLAGLRDAAGSVKWVERGEPGIDLSVLHDGAPRANAAVSAIKITGDTAVVTMSMSCGNLCGTWFTYSATRSGGSWSLEIKGPVAVS